MKIGTTTSYFIGKTLPVMSKYPDNWQLIVNQAHAHQILMFRYNQGIRHTQINDLHVGLI